MVVLGVLVGVGVVAGGMILRGQGPGSGVTLAPSLPAGSAGASGQPAASGPAASPSASPSVAAEKLTLTGAGASSSVGNKAEYQPSRAIDGDLTTSWQEGSSVEKGQWIEVSFASSRADSIVIYNGFQKSTALFQGNLRLKDVVISVNGGPGIKATLADATKAQTIKLGGDAGATTVRITIVTTYPSIKTTVNGTPFRDAAVSEIQVIGVPGG